MSGQAPLTLETIDAVWILSDIARRNAEAKDDSSTSIRISLSTTIPTSSGPVTVNREVLISAEEVLAILRART